MTAKNVPNDTLIGFSRFLEKSRDKLNEERERLLVERQLIIDEMDNIALRLLQLTEGAASRDLGYGVDSADEESNFFWRGNDY